MAEQSLIDRLAELRGESPKQSAFPPPLTRKPQFSNFDKVFQLNPSAYISEGSRIQFRGQAFSEIAEFTFAYRIMLPSGEIIGFTGDLPATNAFTVFTHTEILPECILMNAQMSQPVGIADSTGFARIVIQGGTTVNNADVWTVSQGYVSNNQIITYPPGQHANPEDGPSFFVQVRQNNPGAGTNFNISPPSSGIHRLLFFTFLLATDATVSTRTVIINLFKTSRLMRRVHSTVTQTASQNVRYIAGKSGFVGSPATGAIYLPYESTEWISQADTIQSAITNLQAGDAITSFDTFWEIRVAM